MVDSFGVRRTALVALVENTIEIRTDTFKIVSQFRRPIPRSSNGIGAWKEVFWYASPGAAGCTAS